MINTLSIQLLVTTKRNKDIVSTSTKTTRKCIENSPMAGKTIICEKDKLSMIRYISTSRYCEKDYEMIWWYDICGIKFITRRHKELNQETLISKVSCQFMRSRIFNRLHVLCMMIYITR